MKSLSGSRFSHWRTFLATVALLAALTGCQKEVLVELPPPPKAAGAVADQLAEIEHCFELLRLADHEKKLTLMANQFERIDTACDLLRGKARFSGPNPKAFGHMTPSEFHQFQNKVALVESNATQCRLLALQKYDLSLQKRWGLLQKTYADLSMMLLAIQEEAGA